MNSLPLPNFESDSHQQTLDLSGLEVLYEEVENAIVEEKTETETEIILRLLGQLAAVNDLVKATSTKLVAANDRLNNLSTFITVQHAKQNELVLAYQAQAARVSGLEHRLAMAVAENQRLKRSWWRKILFWIK